MFHISSDYVGRYRRYRLYDLAREGRADIIPGAGALVNGLVMGVGGTVVQVIQGYSTESDLEAQKGFCGSRLLPFPNRVRDGRYAFGGSTHQLDISRPQEGHAIHGLFWNRPFRVTAEVSGPNGAHVRLEAVSRGDIPGYPFRFRVAITYSLDNHGFNSMLEVRNTGQEALPFGDGWHPYFSWNGSVNDLELRLPDVAELSVDERRIPTGETRPFREFKDFTPLGDRHFDTGFLLTGPAPGRAVTRVFDPVTETELHLWQETGPGKYNYLQVYTPADRSGLALEPMTCAADAFNNGMGLMVLQPGETASAQFGITMVQRYQS